MIPNLREAREVWWCERHELLPSDRWEGVGWICPLYQRRDPCHMVRVTLVDPALVEWVRSLFQECGQCKGSGHELGGSGRPHPNAKDYPCPACNGSGQVLNPERLEAFEGSELGLYAISQIILAFLGYEEGPR